MAIWIRCCSVFWDGEMGSMRRYVGLLGIAAFSLLLSFAHASDAPTATLGADGMVMDDNGGEVALSADLTSPVGWRLWMADEPPRMVLELSDFAWTAAPEIRSTSIVGYEIVETGPSLSELHAVLREPLGILSAEMIANEDGTARLDIRLQPTTADTFQSDLDGQEDSNEVVKERLVVAIDPGHGGTDPGAEAEEIREADLVLEFANRLRDILVASGKCDVVLTRTDDQLISLDARLTAARDGEADVLLSLHADALVDPNAASGIVLYSLDPDAEGAANRRLTERHAPDDRLSGVDLTDVGEDVNMALLDLARSEVAPRTDALSAALLGTFQSAELVVNTKPERQGEFAILKAADIPSILIELGFLSTEADLERLTSEDWQTRAAEAIRDGLLLWAEEDRLQ